MGELTTSLHVKCWETILVRDDISWVGPSADADGFCFGSETGDVIWTDFDGNLQWELPHAAKLGEAINGIAFNAGQMCVTTRDETANWFLPTHVENAVRGGQLQAEHTGSLQDDLAISFYHGASPAFIIYGWTSLRR